MIDWVQRNPLLAALGVAGVLLAIVIAGEAAFGPSLAGFLESSPHRRAVAADAKLLPPLVVGAADQAYPETGARPLFIPTRRPAPEALSEAKGNFAKGQYVLVGVIVVGDSRTAMLKEKTTGRTYHVDRGKEVNGIKVAEIEPQVVTLTLGNDKEVLPLTVQKAAAAANAAVQQGPFTPAAPAQPPGQTASQPAPGQPTVPPQQGQPQQGQNPQPNAPANPAARPALPAPAAPLSTEELLARRRARRAQEQPPS